MDLDMQYFKSCPLKNENVNYVSYFTVLLQESHLTTESLQSITWNVFPPNMSSFVLGVLLLQIKSLHTEFLITWFQNSFYLILINQNTAGAKCNFKILEFWASSTCILFLIYNTERNFLYFSKKQRLVKPWNSACLQ